MKSYPISIKTKFERTFHLLKDAKEFANKYKTTVVKIAQKLYKVEYNGSYSNQTKTGRKYYIIDSECNITNEVVTIIRNIDDKSLYKIKGYYGEYKIVGGLHADILLNIKAKNFEGIVYSIVKDEIKRYNIIRELEKIETHSMFKNMIM